jgi:hypothetical protein
VLALLIGLLGIVAAAAVAFGVIRQADDALAPATGHVLIEDGYLVDV